MGFPTWTLLAVAAFVAAIVAGVALVIWAARNRAQVGGRDRPAVPPAPGPTTGPRKDETRPGTPRTHTPRPPAAPTAAGPEVLNRDSLGGVRRPFDPGQWDDRPDGYEGTDLGLIGGDETAAPDPAKPQPGRPETGESVDSSFIESLRRARERDDS